MSLAGPFKDVCLTSLYAAYVEEREGASVYETERGMAMYSIVGQEVYIRELYVKPEYRRTGEAAQMADHVATLAKERGCTFMTGSVCPQARNATDSLKVLLAYGMKLHSATPSLIFFTKDI